LDRAWAVGWWWGGVIVAGSIKGREGGCIGIAGFGAIYVFFGLCIWLSMLVAGGALGGSHHLQQLQPEHILRSLGVHVRRIWGATAPPLREVCARALLRRRLPLRACTADQHVRLLSTIRAPSSSARASLRLFPVRLIIALSVLRTQPRKLCLSESALIRTNTALLQLYSFGCILQPSANHKCSHPSQDAQTMLLLVRLLIVQKQCLTRPSVILCILR